MAKLNNTPFVPEKTDMREFTLRALLLPWRAWLRLVAHGPGVCHYWLTPAGEQAARELAEVVEHDQ